MDDPSRSVGVLVAGSPSPEQAAALEWLRSTPFAVERLPFDALERGVDVDCLWWHRDAPLPEADPLTERAAAVDDFLAAGGGLLLTLRGMAAVDALEVETVPPDAVGAESVAEPTGVLWRSLYDDHPAVAELDGLRHAVCDRGAVGLARYESVLPARGEALASTLRDGTDVTNQLSVVGWDAGEGAVLGVGAPLAFDEPVPEELADRRNRLTRGCLAALADGAGAPRRPRDAEGMARLRRRVDDGRHRPRYHLTPPANWINDPNGLLEWDGEYHVFYQYNPAGPFHNTIHWGHAVSEDLVRWRDEPVALTPSPDGPDRDGCWSGCAVVDDGTPTLLYTGGRGRDQLPCLATARDDGLVAWTKDAGNPIIEAPPADLDVLETEHWAAEFRDHAVWREDGRWLQLIGTGLEEGGGAALLYSATDLREWEYEGPLLVAEEDDPGAVWECPELLRLDGADLLHVSNYEDVVYFLGERADGGFDVAHRGLLDHGDFYAPQSLDDGDRYLTWGWVPEARDVSAQWDAGWSGALSLPREIELGPDGRLRQRPAAEVEERRERRLIDDESLALAAGERRRLDAAGRALELDLELSLSDAEAVELSVFESADGEERTTIRYGRDGTLTVDRTASSADPAATEGSQSMDVPPHDEPLSLRCFLDGSVVELFANERHCLTSRAYPTREDSTGVSVRAVGGRATVASVSAWTMGDAFR